MNIKYAAIIARIRLNTAHIYVNNVKITRSNPCQLCGELVEDNWCHIVSGCSKKILLKTKYQLNIYQCIKNSTKDDCKMLYLFFADLAKTM